MDFRIKFAAFCAAAIVMVTAGFWLKGLIEEAGQADLLRQQIKDTSDRLATEAVKARDAEDKIQAIRQAKNNIDRKWNALRAQKNRSVCHLDTDALSVLRDADAASPVAR